MTSMMERRERSRENIAKMLGRAPEGVNRKTWLYEQFGIADFDEPDGPSEPLGITDFDRPDWPHGPSTTPSRA